MLKSNNSAMPEKQNGKTKNSVKKSKIWLNLQVKIN